MHYAIPLSSRLKYWHTVVPIWLQETLLSYLGKKPTEIYETASPEDSPPQSAATAKQRKCMKWNSCNVSTN